MMEVSLNSIYVSIIVIIVVYITLHIYRFYSRLAHYPRGPKPLPFIGNLHLLIANSNRHFGYLFRELAQNYGEIYTFWLGFKPVVIISDIETAKQAFNQDECSDRVDHNLGHKVNELLLPNHNAFIMMNMSPEFKVLRKVSIEALRKFLSSNAMSEITHKIVDNTVHLMKSRELGKPFAPFKYIDTIFIRVIYETIFNKPLDFDNHKIDEIIQEFESIQINVIKILVAEYNPVLNMLIKTAEMRENGKIFLNLFIKKFNKFKMSNLIASDNCQSLIESHILSANDMKSEGKDKARYLNDSNIIGNLATLLGAGSDTSRYTFEWILLLMAYYPEMQQRMRDEVNTNIGNNIPDNSDREKCHFVNAFICESLRFRNILPLGGFHMTSSDILIANTTIPKGTMIVMSQFSILNDKNYWQNPDIFSPERFLDSERQFITTKIPAFIPFGTGRRMCIGDKFAMNILFLVLVRLLQATRGMKFELHDRQKTDLEPKRFGFFSEPKTIKLRLIKQN